MSIAPQVVEFLRALRSDRFDGGKVADSQDLFRDGILDSLSTLNLIHFLEAHFDITFGPFLVTRKNFSTVSSITNLVEDLQKKNKDAVSHQ
jgi:acyl carrier protein